MSKTADEQTITGEAAVHRIVEVVDEMRHLWHPTVGKDSGIDGEIELRDPGTGEVRNYRLGVQSRGTTRRMPRETEHSFTYKPSPKDLAYWLSSSQPVLLILSRPHTQELYWRSVQEWAQDPKAKAKGVIRFDKKNHRFDASCASLLFNLRASSTDRVEPPSPPHIPELAVANHLPLRFKTDLLHSVAVPAGDAPQVLGSAWRQNLRQSGALRGGRFWSLAALDSSFVAAIGATDPQQHDLAEILATPDHEHRNVLKEVLVRALVDRVPELRWHAFKRVAYFHREAEHEAVQYSWRSGTPRTVVSVRFSEDDDGHFMRYRHDAAELAVRTLAQGWSVQVTPTYLFTSDGKKLSGYHEEWLAGIKRLDRHNAVSSAVRMWEHLLVEKQTIERPDGDSLFALDPLVPVRLPRSITDKAWRALSDTEAATMADPAPTLFDQAA